MDQIRRNLSHLMRAWPIGCLIILSVFPFALNSLSCNPSNKVFLYFSVLYQVGGGIVLLGGLISKVATIQGTSPLKQLITYVRTFPLWAKPITKAGQLHIKAASSASVAGDVGLNLDTLEGKVEFLLKQVKKLEEKLQKLKEEVNSRFDTELAKIAKFFAENNKRFDQLNELVKVTTIGGWKLEATSFVTVLLGVLLSLWV